MEQIDYPHWQKVWVDPTSLGVNRQEDPEGYRRAYQKAYHRAYHEKLTGRPVVFQTAEQKANKLKEYRRQHNEKKKAERLAKPKPAPTAEDLAAKEELRKLRRQASCERNRLRQAQRRKEQPHLGHERRIKKTKWASWSEIAKVYAEARTLTAETGQQWDCEHIYPIKSDWVCGLHTPENLRAVTRAENARKSVRPLGTLGDELWDINHYSVYWPGEAETLSQKRAKHLKALRQQERRILKALEDPAKRRAFATILAA